MNDNDIIKGLTICGTRYDCQNGECPYYGELGNDCVLKNTNDVLDLIERQKAEIKRLEAEIDAQYEQAKADILGNMADGGVSCHWCIEQHKIEAIHEFAERLEPKLANNTDISHVGYQSIIADVDNLIKELTEEQRNERKIN
jgi:hypothetical protein